MSSIIPASPTVLRQPCCANASVLTLSSGLWSLLGMPSTSLDLRQDILRLKKERNAVILAHNYQTGDIQDIADYVGDSLGLAYQAQKTDADVIAFCGVHFMAETAKIVNPEKTVVLPDLDAGCSLEESCPAEDLEQYLNDHADKNYYVIAYINCSGGVKALCDVICTSGNAVNIVNKAPADRPILFVPDANLGAWVMEQTTRVDSSLNLSACDQGPLRPADPTPS